MAKRIRSRQRPSRARSVEDISRKTILALVVVAVIISLLGTLLVMDKVNQIVLNSPDLKYSGEATASLSENSLTNGVSYSTT